MAVAALTVETISCTLQANDTPERLQDIVRAVALSEAVYKLVDVGNAAAVGHVNAIMADLPGSFSTPISCQCSVTTVPHRYIVAETAEAIYVSFVGTKRLRDLLADVNYWQAPLSPAHGAATKQTEAGEPQLRVHQGFMARARGVPVEQLHALAQRRGKALQFCGTCHALRTSCLCADGRSSQAAPSACFSMLPLALHQQVIVPCIWLH